MDECLINKKCQLDLECEKKNLFKELTDICKEVVLPVLAREDLWDDEGKMFVAHQMLYNWLKIGKLL